MKTTNFSQQLGKAVVAVALLCLLTTCDDSNGVTRVGCKNEPLAPGLVRLFYWGNGPSDEFVANHGEPIGRVRQPLWIADNSILVFTETLTESRQIKGIFQITLDPTTHQFLGVHAFELSYVRWSYVHDPNTGDIYLTYSKAPGFYEIGQASLSGDSVVIKQVVVNDDWGPSGVQLWPGHAGFVFYGIDPNTSIPGFYWRQEIGDSLLLPASLTFTEARYFHFNLDGSLLYFGTASGASSGSSRVYERSMQGGTLRSLNERGGDFIALDVNPVDGRLLVERFSPGAAYPDPGSDIVIIDPVTGSATRQEVRTHEASCRFVLAAEPCWNPAGTEFAFSGSAFTGEGEVYPFILWIATQLKGSTN